MIASCFGYHFNNVFSGSCRLRFQYSSFLRLVIIAGDFVIQAQNNRNAAAADTHAVDAHIDQFQEVAPGPDASAAFHFNFP